MNTMWYVLFRYGNNIYGGVVCFLTPKRKDSPETAGKSIAFVDELGRERSIWYNDAEILVDGFGGIVDYFRRISDLRVRSVNWGFQ